MYNTQSSCSVGGELNRIPTTFKEVMGVPQAVSWKAATDKEIASLKKRGVFELVPIDLVPAGHLIIGNRRVFKIEADNTYKSRLVV